MNPRNSGQENMTFIQLSFDPLPSMLAYNHSNARIEAKRKVANTIYTRSFYKVFNSASGSVPPISVAEERQALDELSQAFLWYSDEYVASLPTPDLNQQTWLPSLQLYAIPGEVTGSDPRFHVWQQAVRLACCVRNILIFDHFVTSHGRLPVHQGLLTYVLPEALEYHNKIGQGTPP